MQSRDSKMEMNFCRRCGKPLTNIRAHIYKCETGHTLYANSSPVVDVFFISDDNTKVLLAERGREPHKGKLDGPGGFLDSQEDFEAAATRELTEELGLQPAEYDSFQYLNTGTAVYTADGEEIPLAYIGYWSRLKTNRALEASDDVASVDWHDIHTIDLSLISTGDVRESIMTLQKMFPLTATGNE